jgi:hypothetical protein
MAVSTANLNEKLILNYGNLNINWEYFHYLSNTGTIKMVVFALGPS